MTVKDWDKGHTQDTWEDNQEAWKEWYKEIQEDKINRIKVVNGMYQIDDQKFWTKDAAVEYVRNTYTDIFHQ